MCSSLSVTSADFLCRALEDYDDKSIENLLLIQFYFPQPIIGRPRPSSSRIPPQARLKAHLGLPEQILLNELFPWWFWCFMLNNTFRNDP